MKNNTKGMTLIEVMIAGMILLIATTFFVFSYVGFKSKLGAYRYVYTAMNLARDCLEFGESGQIVHDFKLNYSYDEAQKKYRLTSYWQFNPQNYDHPFKAMGDIKSKGMVPTEYPESVRITYKANVHNFPHTGGLFFTTAQVRWKEDLDAGGVAVERMQELAVVPLNRYNDQFKLITGKFWWEKR